MTNERPPGQGGSTPSAADGRGGLGALSADARQLLQALHAGPGKERRHPRLRELYVSTFPDRAADGARDDHLAALLVELERAGALRRSKKAGPAPLPALVTLDRPRGPRRVLGGDLPVFHPALEAARDLRPGLLPGELEVIERINAFLVDQADAPVVARRERSFALFGDEKRLDVLRRSVRFARFVEDELLRCVDTPLPFAWVRVRQRDDARLLIVENSATFDSLAVVLDDVADPPFDIVVWGAGGAIRDTLPFARRLPEHAGIARVASIAYFGDLDPPGVQIAVEAARVAATLHLPPVRASTGLYRALAAASPAPYGSAYRPYTPVELEWLPPDVARRAVALHAARQRVPQEALDRSMLARLVSPQRSGTPPGSGPSEAT
jgi:hypothetical protein